MKAEQLVVRLIADVITAVSLLFEAAVLLQDDDPVSSSARLPSLCRAGRGAVGLTRHRQLCLLWATSSLS